MESRGASEGVITIHRRGSFTLEEAQQILPVIIKLTEIYYQQVEAMMTQLDTIDPGQVERTQEIEEEINELISQWHSKLKRLGAKARGLWLVDLDAGNGYFCWKYPEKEIAYWHSYKTGYASRRRIDVQSDDIQNVLKT